MNGDHNSFGGSASEGASKKTQSFVPLTSHFSSPFPPTTTAATNNAMAVTSYIPSMQTYRAVAVNPLSLTPVSSFDEISSRSRGAPFSATASTPSTPPTLSTALVKNLPFDITSEKLSLMLALSNDLIDIQILPVERSDDKAPRSAVLKFKSPGGALEVKNGLDGKIIPGSNHGLSVEVRGSGSPTTVNGFAPPTAPVGAPTAPSSRQTSRFNETFHGMHLDKITTAHGTNGDLSTPIDGRTDYATLFSTQSPIGNHLAGNRTSGKKLIDAADDEETDHILQNPIGYAENDYGENHLQRRQTVPQIPISRMAGLSLNTSPPPGSMAHYSHGGMNGFSGLSNTMVSPTVVGPNAAYNLHHQQQHGGRGMQPYPPVNPADQHPPCNTLYVGNLPADTSEEELKQLFCRQRGYKRLCFRSKSQGPMCFVEFEDITFATKALNDLYGHVLQNSTKGGIRLSFSKNPLGVRSGQTTALGMNGMGTGFTTASGPPPGLVAPPPGFGGTRLTYTSSPSMGTSTNFPSPAYSNAQYSTYSSPTFQNPSSNVWGNNGFMYNHYPPMNSSSYQSNMMHQRS